MISLGDLDSLNQMEVKPEKPKKPSSHKTSTQTLKKLYDEKEKLQLKMSEIDNAIEILEANPGLVEIINR